MHAMADGRSIFRDAAALSFPRYPGTDGDEKAISWVEERMRERGFETTLEWFTYDIRPAQRALRATMVGGALLVASAGFLTPISPIGGLVLLILALAPSAVFLAWAPWLEKLYRREGDTRTANVVGRRGVEAPRLTLMLMAHHDSKSQSLSFPFRMGCTMIALTGALILASVAVGAVISGSALAPPWMAPAAGGATALAALALATMTSGNRSPGGVDNAGSVAIMLDVAARLSNDVVGDVEVIMLSTGAEEDHMVGAMRWLDAHVDSLPGPVYCLNFDGAGAPGRPVLIERYGLGRLFSSQMSAAARRAADRLSINPRGILMLPGMGIDAIPFAHRCVPCLTLASGSLGPATMSVHSANDRAEHLDPDTLAEIADLAYETMMELAAQNPSQRLNVTR
jgi:hypothetical protein